MPMDFPSSPTAGQSFTSGGTTWVWTVPPSAWKATSGPSGGASYLPITGGQLNPGGLLVGAAGTVPGQGALTLNANTVAPAALFGGTNLRVIGADGQPTFTVLEAHGTNIPVYVGQSARGTAATPTATQSADVLARLWGIGHTGSGYNGGGTIDINATQNWTTSAFGTGMTFSTTPNGGTATVTSLTLAGNSATFSGSITLASPYLYMFNSSGQVNTTGGPYIFADSNAVLAKLGSGASALFGVQNYAGTSNIFTINTNGNATLSGSNIYVNALAGNHATLELNCSGVRTYDVQSKTDGTFFIYDNTGGAARLQITSGGACSASSTWSVISDAALKTEIKDHTRGLADILKLRPRSFRMKDDDREATGLIAQELEEVMPELVGEITSEDGKKIKTVTEAGVLWPLVNAIKELKTEIDDLKIQLSKKA